MQGHHTAISAPVAMRTSCKPLSARPFHSTRRQNVEEKPTTIGPRKSPAAEVLPPREANFGKAQFADFNLKGRVFIVTGGAQGLGLSIAEVLAEAGGKAYLDRQENPHKQYAEALARVVPVWGGSLQYRRADVVDIEQPDKTIAGISDENQRIDGCVVAAGIQQITPAADHNVDDVNKMS
ncbi:hypothetical protein LZ30DRAFT_799839 [Colletotrichum cereale]|nr:hypothetical protein LZ30DRAFT_799839 [Colletotrichum cereale]